jgi:hypothetical protein
VCLQRNFWPKPESSASGSVSFDAVEREAGEQADRRTNLPPFAGLSEFRLISVTDTDFRRNSCLDRIRSKMIALELVYNHFWLVV